MWIELSDGWIDESSEGPYTEILQTKSDKLGERCTICKLYESPWVTVTFRDSKRRFKSLADAKAYAERILKIQANKMRIFKHTLESLDSVLTVGWGSKLLSVKNQKGRDVLYYIESSSQRKQQIRIKLFLTGEELPDISNMHFLDTVLLNDDSFVVHVFWESVNE